MKPLKVFLPYALFPFIVVGCARTTEKKPAPEVAIAKPAEIQPEPEINLKSKLKLDELGNVRPIYIGGVKKIYSNEIAQEYLKRIFGSSVVMRELSDFYKYGYGHFLEKEPGQSDEDYNKAKAKYLKELLPGTFSTENQATRLADQATTYLYWT